MKQLRVITAMIGDSPNEIFHAWDAAESAVQGSLAFFPVYFFSASLPAMIITYNFSVAAANKVISPFPASRNEHRDSR